MRVMLVSWCNIADALSEYPGKWRELHVRIVSGVTGDLKFRAANGTHDPGCGCQPTHA